MGELLTGRVAVVTGAGRGIGRGIAVELAREGAKVMVASRSQGSIDATLGEIATAGGEAMGRVRSEEHTSELQSLMRNSYADLCFKKKKKQKRYIKTETSLLILQLSMIL